MSVKDSVSEILKGLNGVIGKTVSNDDLSALIKALRLYFQRLDKTVITTLKNNRNEAAIQIKDIEKSLDRQGTELTKQIKDLDSRSSSNLKESIGPILEGLKILSGRLPEGISLDEIVSNLNQASEVLSKLNELITAENIRNALETLDGDDRLHVSAISGLDEILQELRKLIGFGGGGGGGMSRSAIIDIDISPQFNGVLKTFPIQAVYNIVSVSLSSYPYGSLRKGIDYTHTDQSITFTSEIDAETQLSVGQKCVIVAVTT